jgi:hypothetical protein
VEVDKANAALNSHPSLERRLTGPVIGRFDSGDFPLDLDRRLVSSGHSDDRRLRGQSHEVRRRKAIAMIVMRRTKAAVPLARLILGSDFSGGGSSRSYARVPRTQAQLADFAFVEPLLLIPRRLTCASGRARPADIAEQNQLSKRDHFEISSLPPPTRERRSTLSGRRIVAIRALFVGISSLPIPHRVREPNHSLWSVPPLHRKLPRA